MGFRTKLAVVAATATAGLSLGVGVAAPASASTSGAGFATPHVVKTTDSVLRNGFASPANACSYTAFGVTGWFVCGTTIEKATWNDGSVEYFGIGTNYQVYHIASWFGAWRSMGGQADDMFDTFYNYLDQPTVKVYVNNASHHLWCSSYTTAWSGWYAC